MSAYISHPLIKPKSIESRIYQEVLAARVIEQGNTLVVAPTALGKTVVAVLVAAHVLKDKPDSKVLFLAPTKPLAVQHQKSFEKFLAESAGSVELLTGATPAKKRDEIWESASVISATPQTIENALVSGKLRLDNVGLIIFDEAHRAVGDYAYVFIAKMYAKQARHPLILALTASPGSEEEKIDDVCRNLFIRNVEVKTPHDSDVKPYTKEIEMDWVAVELPAEFLEVKALIEDFMRGQLQALRKMGCAKTANLKYYSQRRLLELQSAVRKALVARGKTQPSLFAAVSRTAALLKVSHALALLETQGISALKDYFDRLEEKSTHSGAPKALKMILADAGMLKAMHLVRELHSHGIAHPKLEKLKDILIKQFHSHPESSAIVFNHYRDSVKNLVAHLHQFPEIRARHFIGQATKDADKGMSQKEQSEVIDALKQGTYNTLICTSVAEEGLDIPAVDLVVFYEAVPSEIRSIQRRGRTGRFSKGRAVILIAKGTRDEAFYWASVGKERRMHRTLKELRKNMHAKLPSQSTLVKYIEEAKDKVIIYADMREQASGVVKHLTEMGAIVKVKQLEVGDYVLTDEIVVERKSIDDFLQSIVDGRLFHQLISMSSNYKAPLVIVEGNPEELFSLRDIHRNAVIGALTSIALNYRAPVLFTKDAEETAEYLFITAKREQLGKEKDIRLRVGRKGLTVAEQQRFIVESLPLIGPNMARKLLGHFGSVSAILKADEKALQQVENLGEKKARLIRKVVDGKYDERKQEEDAG